MSLTMIGFASFILLMLVMLAIMLQTIIKDNRRRIQRCDSFMDVFTTMLNDEARSTLKLSKENLRNLYNALDSTAVERNRGCDGDQERPGVGGDGRLFHKVSI